MAWKLFRAASDETITLDAKPVHSVSACSWLVDGRPVVADATGAEWTPIPPTTPWLNVPAFMMRFHPDERLAIRASENPVIVDFLRLVDDPRVQSVDLAHPSVQGAVMYMALVAAPPLIAPDRVAEILAPEPIR